MYDLCPSVTPRGLPGRVTCPPCSADLPVCGPRLFSLQTLVGRIITKRTDKKIFFLKENDLEKGWYVIFVMIILACKHARKKPNEFWNANQILKKARFLESGLKSQSGNPGRSIITF
jgi:hypothetical protein